jgi:ATP-dependent 26S proteasome regulatory subunit
MITQENIRWKSLGKGRQAPPGSIPDSKLAQRISDYKKRVAGKYRSLAPQDITRLLPPGEMIVSPKIDGETWFLKTGKDEAWLLSPSGKIITDIPVTQEATKILGKRHLLLAGEFYANGLPTRPRLHDLHTALGGGENAQIKRLRFAAFDLLEDNNGGDCQRHPFPDRAKQLMKLLPTGKLCHSAPFQRVSDAKGVSDAYERLVTRQGHEGIVVRTTSGPIWKIKPEISIDAVVVGFTERTRGGIAELLLALMRPDGNFQLIGRMNTGFKEAERYELSRMLTPLAVQSNYLAASRSGALFRFLKPEIVVEIKCNDLLAIRSSGEPVRRMALEYHQDSWQPIRPMPAVSLINAVFLRTRNDKIISPDSIRMSQVTDLVPIETADITGIQLPCSTVLRREVFSKVISGQLCVRKLAAWKTNKEETDPLYPPYVIFFTDFVPGRSDPLRTDVRIASGLDKINTLADTWLNKNINNGWKRYGESDEEERSSLSLPPSCSTGKNFRLDLEISFARTSSINFLVAVRRIKALTKAGTLKVEEDNKGRPCHYALIFDQKKLVENVRRIENLYRVIYRWKGAEFLVNDDPLEFHDFQSVLNILNDIAACWRRQKRNDLPCRKAFALGCRRLQFQPTSGFPGIPQEKPAWYSVGEFDGKVVTINNDKLIAQLDTTINEPLVLCPLFDRKHVMDRIKGLPEKLDPAKESGRWAIGYHIENNAPAWVFPKNIRSLPFGITLEPEQDRVQKTWRSTLRAAGIINNSSTISPSFMDPSEPSTSTRNIPTTRYHDICGQDAAVDMVRDYAELPLLHPELFERVGIKPGRGILLWGPPGNAKTMLARAVAGESGAHIETISGPEVLSKWVGEASRTLREIFDRAAQLTPSVVIMDEIDAIAGSRDSGDFPHLRDVVSQLLVLMDGLTERGRILVIATTNLPNNIDPAIIRPGRIDRQIFMGPPDKNGRTALFDKFIDRMPVAENVRANKLAAITENFSGAEIEHAANEAGLLAVKEAIKNQTLPESVQVLEKHFLQSINNIKKTKTNPTSNYPLN